MTRYSVQPRDRTFTKGCGFLSFAIIMDKNIGKNISKNLISRYSQNLLQMHLKLLQKKQFKKQQKELVI